MGGFAYAGLQWKGECWCGNSYGKYGLGEPDKCNCERGSEDFGFWHQCIYEVAEPKLEAPASEASEAAPVSEASEAAPVSEAESAEQAPADGKWVKGPNGQTCDEVCSAEGLACNSSMMDTLTTNDAVAEAFASIGYECKSFHIARDYPGSPFSTARGKDDCAPLLPGSKSVCNGNKYGHHSLLCYCGKSEDVPAEDPSSEEVEPSAPASEDEESYEGAKFVGCYKDQKDRDLEEREGSFKLGERETCFDRCRAEGFQFAGLQWKGQCFCGNSYGSYGEGEECDCSRGSKNFGKWEQCIYEVAKSDESWLEDEDENAEKPCAQQSELSMLQGLRQWLDGLADSGEISAEQRGFM